MPTPAANFRRFIKRSRTVAAGLLCALLATTAGTPVAAAASARDLLAGAIANTRGSYLVYNFGSGFPAPMLNATGNWYEMTNGGRLMIIKAASQRLAPRLLADSHTGYQARCERDPRARTGEGLWQASEIYSPLQAWQALGQPTFADQRQLLRRAWPEGRLMEVDRLQFAAGRLRRQHPRPGPRPTPRSPERSPMRASKGCQAGTRTGSRCRR